MRKIDQMKKLLADRKAKGKPASHSRPGGVTFVCGHTVGTAEAKGQHCAPCQKEAARRRRAERSAKYAVLPDGATITTTFLASRKEWVGELSIPLVRNSIEEPGPRAVFHATGFPLDRVCRELGKKCREWLAAPTTEVTNGPEEE